MWWEIQTTCSAETAAILAEDLMEMGALSVTTEDANADSPDEQALFAEPGMEPVFCWDRNIVTAIFNREISPEETFRAAESRHPCLKGLWTLRHVEEQDWVSIVQNQFGPMQISERLWVVPSWCKAPSDPNALVISLDPGLAFGTGSHATTKLCLQWLTENFNSEWQLLDYGCGSGILTIAAGLLGGTTLVGIDIDPSAVQVAQSNAQINGITAKFCLPEEAPQGTLFEVVIANILSHPLRGLASLLIGHCAPNGWVVLSGILESQASMIQEYYLYVSQGKLQLKIWGHEEGWVCLAGQLKS